MNFKGFSIYKCNEICEYHFAVEIGNFPDITEPSCCPICKGKNVSFVNEVENINIIK